jgi:hypothetical protein
MNKAISSCPIAACILMLVAICGACPVARAASDAGVGVVAEYRPAAGRFTFARPPRGEAVPVQIGSVVMAGDRVTLPAGGAVTVQLANGETARFKGPGTFVVPDARPLGRLQAIFQSLPALFDDEFRLSGTAASRGGDVCGQDGRAVGPIAVPILVPGASIKAGTRDLPLGWRGGCPPFVVAVHASPNRDVHRESIEGWQLRLDQVPLPVGRYLVVITDATGQRFDTSLDALADMPVVPADLATDTSNLGITAQAVWLAGQDGGRWRLDAFDRLRPLIRAGDPLAGSIGDGLLWGPAAPAAH